MIHSFILDFILKKIDAICKVEEDSDDVLLS